MQIVNGHSLHHDITLGHPFYSHCKREAGSYARVRDAFCRIGYSRLASATSSFASSASALNIGILFSFYDPLLALSSFEPPRPPSPMVAATGETRREAGYSHAHDESPSLRVCGVPKAARTRGPLGHRQHSSP